mgnify:CR=1 FL=1|jgi:hypothetical protein|tara:strand:- start:1986 stop:2183 length:198 start_codon:yes stop_codon:yes gene_type:complete
MSFEALLLNRLKVAQAEFATSALKQPINRDAFEYGYRVGTINGFESAINILLSILDEEQNSDKNL